MKIYVKWMYLHIDKSVNTLYIYIIKQEIGNDFYEKYKKGENFMKKVISTAMVLTLTMAMGTTASADIRVSTSANAGKPGLEACGPAFEEATGIKVETEFMDVGGSTAMSSLLTELQAGTAPDIFVPLPSTQDLAEADMLLSLDDTEYGQSIKGTVFENYVSYNDSVYGALIGIQPVGVIYNTSLFEEYELEIPQTWDEFIALIKKIREVAPDKTPLAWGGGNAAISRINLHAIIINQPGYTGTEGFDCTFSESEAYKAGLAAFQELIDAEAFSPSASTDGSNEVVASFVAGDAFMDLDCSSRYAAIKRADENCPIAMFALPAANAEDTRLLIWPGTIESVSAAVQDSDGALQFIDYITGTEGNTLWVEAAGGSEMPLAVLNDPDNWFEYLKPLSVYADVCGLIPSADWASVNPDIALGEGGTGMLTGVMTAEDVLASMDEEWANMQ